MANAYGTKEYEKYIEEYRKSIFEYEFVKTEKSEEHFETNGIRFDATVSDNEIYKNENDSYPRTCTSFAEITVTLKDGRTNKYSTIEGFFVPQVFTYKGIDYIFMKKSLYGYCIIDSRNFEEYNYFPSEILKGEDESFICCEVYALNDLLLFIGCYWACPYEIYVLELDSKKVLRLDNYRDFEGLSDYDIGDCTVKAYENSFAITSKENPKEYFICYDKLKKLIEKDGKLDF